jgi:hypothetical protein
MTLKSIYADSMKDLITVKVCIPIGHLHPDNMNNSEFSLSLHE